MYCSNPTWSIFSFCLLLALSILSSKVLRKKDGQGNSKNKDKSMWQILFPGPLAEVKRKIVKSQRMVGKTITVD
jgi:hypothetical protein